MTELKIGIIGLSEGNGHPYSWSAIFNGFDSYYMKDCPFPVIPQYLSERQFPKEFLNEIGTVNSIWTQEIKISENVAKSAFIKNVCVNIEDLIKYSDAILLARDDAENHLEMARFFLEQGAPIFIDKPFATSIVEANEMIHLQRYDYQIFTCSSLRYAEELLLSNDDLSNIGQIREIEANCPKYWNTYAVHLLEPIIVNCPDRGQLLEVKKINSANHTVRIKWENLNTKITMTGNEPSSLYFKYIGELGEVSKQFSDSFSCFKSSLRAFVEQVQQKENIIPREETLEIVKILEDGK